MWVEGESDFINIQYYRSQFMNLYFLIGTNRGGPPTSKLGDSKRMLGVGEAEVGFYVMGFTV